MTPTEIRSALTEVRDATEVPVVDRVAFQRRVRAERRRRTAGRTVVAGAAAAVVVAGVALAGLGGGDDERRVDTGPAGSPTAGGQVRETVFFVLDGRLAALDPAGEVHDLGMRSEGVLGFTSEQAYVLDDDSRVVAWAVSYDEESRAASFDRVASPVLEPVQRAALSGDGRYLGWTGLDDVSHRYDLKAGREDLTVEGDPQTAVADVGSDGLLLHTRGGLELRAAGSTIEVPVADEEAGTSSQLAFGHVLVNEPDGRSLLYDVRGGEAALVDTLPGSGLLGPYAERVAVTGEGWVEVWDGGTVLQLTGLEAMPEQVRWADETTLLVAGRDASGAGLWACDIELACRALPVSGEVRLGE